MEEIFYIYPENKKFVLGDKRELAQDLTIKSAGEKFSTFLFITIFSIAGIVLIVTFFYQFFFFLIMNFSSEQTTGIYLNSRVVGSGDETEYIISYTFSVNGVSYNNESEVSYDLFSKFNKLQHPEDEPLLVYYYTKNPNVSTLKPPSIKFVLFHFAFATIWNLLFYGVFIFLFKKRERLKNLAKNGKIIDGKLINCSGYTDEGDFYIKGEYNFISPSTRDMIQGKFHSLREDLRNQKLPGVGTKIKVIYLNDKTFDVL